MSLNRTPIATYYLARDAGGSYLCLDGLSDANAPFEDDDFWWGGRGEAHHFSTIEDLRYFWGRAKEAARDSDDDFDPSGWKKRTIVKVSVYAKPKAILTEEESFLARLLAGVIEPYGYAPDRLLACLDVAVDLAKLDPKPSWEICDGDGNFMGRFSARDQLAAIVGFHQKNPGNTYLMDLQAIPAGTPDTDPRRSDDHWSGLPTFKPFGRRQAQW